MKKYLLLLMILIGSNFAGQSQTGSRDVPAATIGMLSDPVSDLRDTLCFPVPIIRKILIAAEQKKVCDSLLSIANFQVFQLQTTISLLNEKDTAMKGQYERQIANLESQKALYVDQIKGYERLLKRERLKRKLITGAGILTTGAAILLTLRK